MKIREVVLNRIDIEIETDLKRKSFRE